MHANQHTQIKISFILAHSDLTKIDRAGFKSRKEIVKNYILPGNRKLKGRDLRLSVRTMARLLRKESEGMKRFQMGRRASLGFICFGIQIRPNPNDMSFEIVDGRLLGSKKSAQLLQVQNNKRKLETTILEFLGALIGISFTSLC